MRLILWALVLAGCEYRSQSFPDGSFNPNHALVLCSPTACERPRRPQTFAERQSTCAAEQECVARSCDGGTCEGFCFDGGGLSAQCDSHGCCAFSCDGIAGNQCPQEMRCLSSPECCDFSGTCTR
jgi:hypothetical protein